MLSPGDQLRRIEELTDRVRQPRERRSEGATLIGKVISVIPGGDYSPAFWTVRPQDIGGTESEGSAVTYADAGDTILGLHLSKPENGQVYLYRLVQGRWVADKSCTGCSVTVSVFYEGGGPIQGVEVTVGDATGFTSNSGQVTLPIPGPGTYQVTAEVADHVYFDEELELDCGSEVPIEIPVRSTRCCPAVPLTLPLWYKPSGIGAVFTQVGTLTFGNYTIPFVGTFDCWGGAYESPAEPGSSYMAYLVERPTGACFTLYTVGFVRNTDTTDCSPFYADAIFGVGIIWAVGEIP